MPTAAPTARAADGRSIRRARPNRSWRSRPAFHEIANAAQADYIDEVEVGRRVAGKFRVAFEVTDATDVTERLAASGATVVAEPVRTPWDSLNSRLEAPGGLQLTLFEELA